MQVTVHAGMSLFDSPRGSCLVHATNCQGVWGAGIASEMKLRFPDAYLSYKTVCGAYGHLFPGLSLVIPTESYSIGCLFTSVGYGRQKDPPELILGQTDWALAHFIRSLPLGVPIYSCEFNSGLFGVPWEKTEALILAIDDQRVWNVCKL